ncbi:MAG: alpha/beta hydrolase [Alistipes sp.]
MKKIALLLALFATFALQAQNIKKQTFLYSVKDSDSLYLDRYVALENNSATKPCLIFVFGGGFVRGQRDATKYVSFFEYMAQKGFNVVSIDYRLGLKKAMANGPLNEQAFAVAWIQTLAMATEDLYDATNYVLTNAEAWNIDKNCIVSCGSSAGAITVLLGEYYLCNDGVLAQTLPAGFNYAGVISFAGAIFDMGEELRWKRTPAPIQLFHGNADKNVPYNVIREFGAGFFGSKHISDQLSRMKVPHYFYSVENTDHVMAESPMDNNRYEIDAFLAKLVFKKMPLIITTQVDPLDQTNVKKDFSMMDYLQANFAQ